MERLTEFEQLSAAGAPFSALTRLGQITLVLDNLSASRKNKWREIVAAKLESADVGDNMALEIERRIDRIRRISQHGTKCVFEELTLLLSLRLDVKCALACMQARSDTEHAMKRIDDLLIDMSDSPADRRDLERAAEHISKNFGLPVGVAEILPGRWTH